MGPSDIRYARSGDVALAYQITVEAMAVGFTAIFIMLLVDKEH